MRTALFVILGIMVLALAYDFLWARRQQSAAAEQVQALMDAPPPAGQAVIKAEPITHEQVIAAVGCDPAEESEGNTYYLERFSWRSGLPWRTHDLYVIYTKGKPRLLHDFSVGQPPERHQLPMTTEALNATPPDQTEEPSEAGADAADAPAGGAEGAAAEGDQAAPESGPGQ